MIPSIYVAILLVLASVGLGWNSGMAIRYTGESIPLCSEVFSEAGAHGILIHGTFRWIDILICTQLLQLK
jgi:hypothetical protein